jgi:hypothetical protein
MNRNKTKLNAKLRTLELRKETIITLVDDQLKHVVGGIPTTIKSQCPTLCFT